MGFQNVLGHPPSPLTLLPLPSPGAGISQLCLKGQYSKCFMLMGDKGSAQLLNSAIVKSHRRPYVKKWMCLCACVYLKNRWQGIFGLWAIVCRPLVFQVHIRDFLRLTYSVIYLDLWNLRRSLKLDRTGGSVFCTGICSFRNASLCSQHGSLSSQGVSQGPHETRSSALFHFACKLLSTPLPILANEALFCCCCCCWKF